MRPPRAAIGRGDDPLPADDVGETNDPLGDEFGMLDDIGGVTDDPGQDQLVVAIGQNQRLGRPRGDANAKSGDAAIQVTL